MSAFKEYVLATRPWSFTASVVPVLLTAAVVKAPLLSADFLRCLAVALFVHCGGNLTNTYFDFVNGVDTKYNTGEKTLVEKKVSAFGLMALMTISYALGVLAVLPLILAAGDKALMVVFGSGLLLAFFYTANPVGLKYRCLGDVTIFLCFGPLLMQCTAIMLTGSTTNDIYPYSVPLGLLTEAILHANNARDIKADSEAGATTLCTILGFQNSLLVYGLLLAGAYAGVVYVSCYYHVGCMAALLTVPLAIGLMKDFQKKDMQELPDKTAQTHLPFGILMTLGILFTSKGLLEMI
jgi:1,4-dihydroxy-2-naphthoate octaprenyltransferase